MSEEDVVALARRAAAVHGAAAVARLLEAALGLGAARAPRCACGGVMHSYGNQARKGGVMRRYYKCQSCGKRESRDGEKEQMANGQIGK